MKKLLLLLLGSSIVACQPGSQKDYVADLEQRDTLLIAGYFSECGEWGGHREKIKIYKQSGEAWITYIKDSVSCSRDPNNDRRIVRNVARQATMTERSALNNYIHKVYTQEVSQPILHYASDFYQIKTKDTLITVEIVPWNEFKNLTEQLDIN